MNVHLPSPEVACRRPGGRLWALARPFQRHLRLLVGCVVAWLLCVHALAQGSTSPAAVDVSAGPALDLWAHVTLLRDPSHTLTAEALAADPQAFAAPVGTPANLGRTSDAVWLRVPLHVPGLQPMQRVLEVDYPALNRIDVALVREGRILTRSHMGNQLPLADRPLPTRAHAVTLDLPPGDSALLIRVVSQSSLVLPLRLYTPAAHHRAEGLALLVHGVFNGVSLFMLLYSLVNGLLLRDRVFGQYALMLAGNLLFFAAYFGTGALSLWPEAPELAQRIAPIAVLVAVVGGAGFVNSTLEVATHSPWASRALTATAALALATAVAGVLGLVPYGALQTLAIVLGLLATNVALPTFIGRARQGERVALLMLVGWVCYALGVAVIAALLRGWLAPGFWALHAFALAVQVEMLIWTGVLVLRVQGMRRQAELTRLEGESVRMLAFTDALTGLPNRRGLTERLKSVLPDSRPGSLLAVYLVDLDGFKPINDRYGHDVGDALLRAVGQRLANSLRQGDNVARLGGDEFVVLAGGLADEAAAEALGAKMVAAFREPMEVSGQVCQIGMTVGYALAPVDSGRADELLKYADAAMYAGKQAGRGQVRRGTLPSTRDAVPA